MAAFFLIETTIVLGLAATPGVWADPVHMGRGGRTWWAHLRFTPIDIQLPIPRTKIEELMNVQGIGEKTFLKLKPQLTVVTSATSPQQR